MKYLFHHSNAISPLSPYLMKNFRNHNQPLSRPSNCSVCDLAANDKLFVLPVSQGALNSNENLKQYPGYN